MKKSFADIIGEENARIRQRLIAKVPEWGSCPGLLIPSRINAEQCSSSPAALYKASVAKRSVPGASRIADLSGGLGVDCWAFSSHFAEVLYNDADAALADAVKANFAAMGISNVTWRNAEIRPGNVSEVLGGFAPGIIYLDPARRSSSGQKLFRLEDCSPDLRSLLPELLALCPRILAKVSPMADISLLRKQLPLLGEVHVVSVDGECKELLLLIGEGIPFSVCVATLGRDGSREVMTLPENELRAACPLAGEIAVGQYLYEPGAALAKSGGSDAVCARAGLGKLAPSTHLYLSEEPIPSLAAFGRFRRIAEVLPLDKRTLRDAGARYPDAEVSARNIPMSSEELCKRLGTKGGGRYHIFGAGVSQSGKESAKMLIITTLP